MTPEHTIQNAILSAIGTRPDVRLWRANAGVAVVGDVGRIMSLCRRAGLAVRMVSFGVPGQADLSGIVVGGQRLEIEVKSASGRQSAEQANYGQMIHRMGGIYVLARSVEDVLAALRNTHVND